MAPEEGRFHKHEIVVPKRGFFDAIVPGVYVSGDGIGPGGEAHH